MGFYTGRTGALYLIDAGTSDPSPSAQQKALKLRDWSLETTVELLETTTVDTAVKAYTPGASSASGSATLLYYRREGNSSTEPGTQFNIFLSKIMKTSAVGVRESDRVGIVLRVGTEKAAGADVKDDIAFNAYITNASLQVSTGELSAVSLQFTVDGPFREIIQ